MVEPLTSDDPRQVADYRLRGRLGAGGMGRVYLALTPGGRRVALKMMRAEFGDDEQFRARFRQEVAAARRVHGLFTAQVLDAGPDAPQPWLATSYVPGLSLRQAVTEHGPLPPDTVFHLLAGIAEALQAIHTAGIIHRDLKPSNVILAADGPRVIDFGIARAAAAPALTQGGSQVGSPWFMAPEQACGQPATSAADVFALGSLTVYAAAGHPPFGTDDPVAVLHRVRSEPPDLAGCPPELRPLIRRCLGKSAAQRPLPRDIIDTCRARAGEDGLAFDHSWLPAGIAAAAAVDAPLPSGSPAALAGGELRDGLANREGTLSGADSYPSAGSYPSASCLDEDTFYGVVRNPAERPAGQNPSPGARSVAGPPPPEHEPGPPAAAAKPGGPFRRGALASHGWPKAARPTVIGVAMAAILVAAAVTAATALLPGLTTPGRSHQRNPADRIPRASSRPARSTTSRRVSPGRLRSMPSPAHSRPGPSATQVPTAPAASSTPAAPPSSGRAAFGGTWTGSVSQPGWSVPRWSIELVIPASGGDGSYHAPSLGCAGTLHLPGGADTSMTAQATTTSAVNPGCVARARLTLSLTGSGQLSLTWAPIPPAHPKTSGTALLARG